MASSNIDIIINAQDKTRDAFNKAQSGMEGFKSRLEGLRPAFLKMGAVGGVALAGLAAGIKGCMQEAIEAQKVSAQLNAVLESTGGIAGVTADMANQLADSYAKITLFSDDAILSAENLMLTFTSVGKDIFPEATMTALNMSTALGQDLQSSVTQLGKALNNPIDGISALSRVGVQFTEDQKAMIERMVESGDVMGAQKVILAELNTEFGKSAENAANADPFAMMKKSADELKESIGKALMPAFTELEGKIKPIVDKIKEWVEENPKLTSELVIIAAVLAGLAVTLGIIGVALPLVIAGFTLLFSPITIIIIGIIMLIAKWKEFKQMWVDLWDDIKGAAKVGADAIMSFLQPVFDFVMKIVNAIDKAVSFVGDKIGIGGGKKKKVNDAVINPSGDVVETNPNDWLIATQNPGALFGGLGGGLVVNINGGTYLDEGVAADIGDMILKRLQFNMRGS